MKNSKKGFTGIAQWALAIMAVMAILLISSPVFAEAESPPEEEPPVEVPTGEVPTEESTVEAPAFVDATTTESPAEEPADEAVEALVGDTAVSPEEETTTNEASVMVDSDEETLEEVPAEDGTFVSEALEAAAEAGAELVNAEGEPLDMASQETAELLSSGDPYYTVGTATYSFYASGGMCGVTPNCQDGLGAGVIQFALDYMNTTGLPSDGMLYVEGGTYNGFDVNGFSDPWLASLNGVIGVDGSESTTINGDINILNNTGGFTLAGFTLNSGGSIYVDSNSGTFLLEDVAVENSTDLYGIRVTNHSGPVEFNGVNASNNDKVGATIDNTASNSPITIKNSAFNDNGWAIPSITYDGLTINSASVVILEGIAACGNNGNGITLYDYGTLSIKDTYMMGNNTSASSSRGYALYATTSGIGTASLENVYAYGNDKGISIVGGSLKATNIEVNDSSEGGGLTFSSDTGSSRIDFGRFHNNAYGGLVIRNKGSITLNSVQATDNGWDGAFLDNAYWDYGISAYIGTGSVTITSPNSGFIFDTANAFHGNGDTGITIISRGSVKLSNFDTTNNGSYGVYINNTSGSGSVTIDENLSHWANGVYNNGSNGIDIDSNGTVKVFGTQAQFNGNSGLYVTTLGTIELKDFGAESNEFFGAYLNNYDGVTPKTVKLTNVSLNHNEGGGLYVYTKGSITAYGLTASGNSLRDTNLGSASNKITYNDLIGAEYIEDVFTFEGTAGQWVDLNLESDDFDTYLILVDPSGSVEEEDDDGWYDNNSWIGRNLNMTGTYTVIVKSVNNWGFGRYAFSLNDAGHSNVSSPSYNGAYLNNSDGSGSVTINKPSSDEMWGNFFDFNTSYGLLIESNGNINIDSAGASGNKYSGLWLNNPGSHGSVQLQNTRTDDFYSEFSRNGGYGVFIQTQGNITLKNINAHENNYYGIYVDNCLYNGGTLMCDGFGGVKVLASSDRMNEFLFNDGYGLMIFSKNSIILTNLYAEGNTNTGVYATNNFLGASGSIKLTTTGKNAWNGFAQNGWNGLNLYSNGSISASKMSAWENGGNGVSLDNDSSLSALPINITNAYFDSNDDFGLFVYSNGNISWKYGGAWNNGFTGAYFYNLAGTGTVSVKGSSKETMWFENNGFASSGEDGLEIVSNGNITVQYASANNNNGYGICVINTSSTTNRQITLSDIQAHGNVYTGLWAQSRGSISVKGIQAMGNGQNGAYLVNDFAGASGNVTVATTKGMKVNELKGNQGGSGLYVSSAGNVQVTNATASGNVSSGIYITKSAGTGWVTVQTTLKEVFGLHGNGSYGLFIFSNGAINVKNKYLLLVGENGSSGVWLSNTGAPVPSAINIENVSSNGNNGYGIYAETDGSLTAKSIAGSGNNQNGASLYSGASYVSVTGENFFTDNDKIGLGITANGAITISGTFAGGNGWLGIDANSFNGGAITVTNTTAAHNHWTGIWLGSSGNFTLSGVKAFLNGQDDDPSSDDGLSIDGGSSSTVTIKDSTFMTNWWGSGIEIDHPWAIDPDLWLTMINVNYLSNGGPNLFIHT